MDCTVTCIVIMPGETIFINFYVFCGTVATEWGMLFQMYLGTKHCKSVINQKGNSFSYFLHLSNKNLIQ